MNDIYTLTVEEWKRYIREMLIFLKRAGIATLISDKVHFRTKEITRDKEGCYIMIKWSIHQEDITVLNIHAPNNKASKYIIKTGRGRNRQVKNNSLGFQHPT